MECQCESETLHNILQIAGLCGPVNSLSELSSRSCSPESIHSTGHLDSINKTTGVTRRNLLKQEKRQKIDQRRQEHLKGFKRKLQIPGFATAQNWHLDQGRRCKTGYKGDSTKICKTIPPIPTGACSATQLEVLQKNGYKIVPAPT
jgi:hypothetical protein